jgi:hypothetical protein
VSDSIDRAIVIQVLRRNSVSVKEQNTDEPRAYLLVKAERLEVIELHPEVARRMLQYLQRKFGVPIHLFFNPDMQ